MRSTASSGAAPVSNTQKNRDHHRNRYLFDGNLRPIVYYFRVIDRKDIQIISGGQTGVDRAALDVAANSGISSGGWCPKGRLAEDGVLSERYPLKETDSPVYSVRTEKNVVDSDGTLILYQRSLSGGTALTRQLALQHQRPCLLIDLSSAPSAFKVVCWIKKHQIKVLNIAGPRESGEPGIYQKASKFLSDFLDHPQ